MGCKECVIDGFGRPVCEVCDEGYVTVDDMPHLCAFLQSHVVPIGYALDNGNLITSSSHVELFNFDLRESAETLANEGFSNCIEPTGHGETCWNVHLRNGNNRRDSVHHATRGMWFDGKYDYLIMNGTLPARMHINFWIKPYHDGSLFSVSGKYDEANQHLISAGVRGKRLESQVEYGDDLHHPDRINQLRADAFGLGY
jgi:hypothetical protein